MNLKNLSIRGFKCFDEEVSIDFESNAPGLYFLTGKNLVDPNLGANGAGKSTTLDAIVWVLFEQTSRKLKAKNIKNWNGSQKVQVCLSFESHAGKDITVKRTWQPNSLKWAIDGGDFEDVKQAELEDAIGMNYDMYLSSVMIPQFSTMFFDERPSQQAQMFTDILQLDEWLTYSDAAKAAAASTKGLVNDAEHSVTNVEGQIIACNEMNYSDDIDKWDADQQVKIREAGTQIPILKESIKKQQNRITAFHQQDNEREAEQREYLEEIEAIQKEIKDIRSDISDSKKPINEKVEERAEIKAQIAALTKRESKINNLGAHCNACEQPIDESHVNKQLEELEFEISELIARKEAVDAEVEKLIAVRAEFEKELDDANEELDEFDRKSKKVANKLRESANTVSNIERDIKHVERDISRLTASKADLKAEINPFLSKARENEERIEMLEGQREAYERDATQLRKQLAEYTYWTKQFKEVRLFLISEALTQLEVEVNSNLARLGMHDWEITFDVESEKSDGTLKKGFSVFIKSPSNAEPVPWEAWSGGEAQRLRIAGITGLTNLILNRKGIECNCEFWDEPTNGISADGVKDLVATLKEHALSSGRQVWLVDHRSLSHGAFKKVVTVVKDKDGTTFETEEVDA